MKARDLIEPVALLGAVYVLSKSVRASRQQLVIAFSEHFDVSAQNQALAVTAAALETCFDHVGGSVTRAMVLAVHAIEERTELQRELLDKLLPVDWPRVFRTMPGKGSLRRACILRKEHLVPTLKYRAHICREEMVAESSRFREEDAMVIVPLTCLRKGVQAAPRAPPAADAGAFRGRGCGRGCQH